MFIDFKFIKLRVTLVVDTAIFCISVVIDFLEMLFH